MSIYIRRGSAYHITNKANLDIHETLPVGNYIIEINPLTKELFFEQVDSFSFKNKIYGNFNYIVDRLLRTYRNRSNNTGVLLSGEKGSGKTLVAKLTSIRGAELGMPTIIINKPLFGDEFNKFMQEISQECIVLFDEFEKIYDRDDQQSLLTLLDGVFPSKKLFLFTCNDKYRVDSNMTNRPGRIYYHMEYQGLENDFVREYCEDNLNNKSYIEAVCRVGSLFYQFNFDMLQAMVEEMNRYDESPADVLKYLNTKPDNDTFGKYDIELIIDGKISTNTLYPSEWDGNPLRSSSIFIEESINRSSDKDNPDWDGVNHIFSIGDLVKIDPQSGEFIFVKGNKKLKFIRKREAKLELISAYNSFFT